MYAAKNQELERTQRLLGGYLTEVESSRSSNGVKKAGGMVPVLLPELFTYSGTSPHGQRTIFIRLALLCVFVCGAALVFQNAYILLGIILLIGVEHRRLLWQSYKRAESFERDYTALLLSLASGIRTGLDPMAALAKSHELFQENSEVRKEVEALHKHIEQGDSEELVLQKFGATIDHPDIKLFRTAFILARKEGSSLALCLQRLAKVTRQRQSFRRKTRAAVAMQKLSAFGIAGCAIIIGVIQVVTNAKAIADALDHPLGSKALFVGVALMVTGLVWMVRMAKARI
ncbi:type II secretion system F family protein [Oligoflexia bacterium]|nr:type II secretion system F family protein [Oligoflexia bacterium]